MAPCNARMFIQPDRPSDVQRPSEPRVRVCDDRSVSAHRNHSPCISQLCLRYDGEIRFSADGAAGATAREVQEVEPDGACDVGGYSIEDTGSYETFVCFGD